MPILSDVARKDTGKEGACDATEDSLTSRQEEQCRSEADLSNTRLENDSVGA